MEIYIKQENELKHLSATPSLEDFQEIVTKVNELENRVDQMQTLFDQQS